MSKDYRNYVMGFSQDLAHKIGLDEAILFNQIDYWLSRTQHFINGRPWVYNSYKDWQAQFPFWSERTVRRLFSSLEEKGIILSSNFNKSKTDRTKWYSIDFEKVESFKKQSDTYQGLSCNGGEKSRFFNPGLAKEIGLNEAIFTNQINYLLSKTKHFFQGDPWIYNSYEAWKTHFPFWSKSTIIRTVISLERQGILLSKTPNKSKKDQTKWYSLNFEKIQSLKRKESQVFFDKFLCDKNKKFHVANMNRRHQTNMQDGHLHVANMSCFLKEQNTNLQKKERAVENPEKINLAKESIKNVKKSINKSLGTWSLSDDERVNTSINLNWDQERIDNELLRFKTYYGDKIRRNWDATWQMWCVRAESFAREREKRVQESQDIRKNGASHGDAFYAALVERTAVEKKSKEKISAEIKELKKTVPPDSPHHVWLMVSERLMDTVGASVYVSWFKDLIVEKVEDCLVVLKAKGRFAADYISVHFLHKIAQAFEGILKKSTQVRIVL
jgi:Fe2+ or Zn2+ uptake regulation protein